MFFVTSKRLIISLLGILLLSCTTLLADELPAPKVETAVHWSNTDGTIEIILTPIVNAQAKTNYRLIVISAKELQVTYHTSVNSTKKVDKLLNPVASTLRDVKAYEFSHQFSRTTIWMALTFSLEDKPLGELTRTFYDGIENSVPNEEFINKEKTL